MAMVIQKIVVLKPTAEGKGHEVRRTRRAISLEGRVMGIIWNGKPGGDILLGRLGELLRKRFHSPQILKLDERADMHSGLAESVVDEFSRKCDLVIIGIGD